MSILPKLFEAYRKIGMQLLTGYNPMLFQYGDAHFTTYINEKREISTVYGIALSEVNYFEGLGGYEKFPNILIIGNSFGFSALAFALIWPKATILTVDPGEEGNEITRRAAAAAGVGKRLIVAEGYSPQDLQPLMERHRLPLFDFVLVDAMHTNEEMTRDFRAALPLCQPKRCIVCHDVLMWDMLDGFNQMKAETGLEGGVLTKTPSGMGILHSPGFSEGFTAYNQVYMDDMRLLEQYRNAAMRHAFSEDLPEMGKHLFNYRKEKMKRLL